MQVAPLLAEAAYHTTDFQDLTKTRCESALPTRGGIG